MKNTEQMLREISDILDNPETKAKVDGIIPLLHGKWELQIMLEVCRADILRFGEYKKRLPTITNSVFFVQSGIMGTHHPHPV